MIKYESIYKLGEKLVKCKFHCKGITNNPEQYIIPRCLHIERRNGKKMCIVIGLNPGKCNKKEMDYYRENGIKYDSVIGYLSSTIKDILFYKNTRELIQVLGYDGDVLWTELAKRQSSGEGKPPIQTLRVCNNKFLKKEIELFTSDTIFAVGNVAFDYCALSYPDHFVVGIPHPTGSRGYFNQLRKNVESNQKLYINEIRDKKDNDGNYRAIHLSRDMDL